MEIGVDLERKEGVFVGDEKREGRRDIRVVMWNINGVGNKEKLSKLKQVVRGFRSLFILIQESWAKDKGDYIFLENAFKKYEWITDDFNQNKHGLAIGVRRMKLRGEVQKIDCGERHGGALAIQTWVAGEEYCALNIYRYSEMSVSQVPRICNQSFSKQSINILGGDFNLDKNQLEFQTVVKAAARHRMLQLEGDFVTHYRGRTIDHLFIPNSCPKDWCFIQGALTGF